MTAAGEITTGRSDRTRFALAFTRAPAPLRGLTDRLFERGECAVLHGTASGLRLPARALRPSFADTRALLLGDLEVPVQEALRRCVRDGDLVHDVGAGIGFFALYAARLAGPSGRVVAFEADRALAELAREAAVRSGLDARVLVRVGDPSMGVMSARDDPPKGAGVEPDVVRLAPGSTLPPDWHPRAVVASDAARASLAAAGYTHLDPIAPDRLVATDERIERRGRAA